jgi:hypothetical protein
MSSKDILGSIWPNYGAVTGEGAHGRTFNPEQAAENDAKDAKRKHEAEMKAVNENRAALQKSMSEGMKKGGKVRTASQRADGIALRGKTRA